MGEDQWHKMIDDGFEARRLVGWQWWLNEGVVHIEALFDFGGCGGSRVVVVGYEGYNLEVVGGGVGEGHREKEKEKLSWRRNYYSKEEKCMHGSHP
ncbi:hypothetical protein RJT34_30920 [Clitoria ternatea]|uniref:Uncharacterized protein n=1 Tax=Clitoria ternatea TaxID=43366 RepID=A0AAN9I2F3_CLITE